MYTQRGQRLHRMCGVWSPLISDRLDAVTAGHLLYLWRFFFFIEDHMSRAWVAVPWRAAHLSADNLPLSRFDVASQNIGDQTFSNANSTTISFPSSEIASIIDRAKFFSITKVLVPFLSIEFDRIVKHRKERILRLGAIERKRGSPQYRWLDGDDRIAISNEPSLPPSWPPSTSARNP